MVCQIIYNCQTFCLEAVTVDFKEFSLLRTVGFQRHFVRFECGKVFTQKLKRGLSNRHGTVGTISDFNIRC